MFNKIFIYFELRFLHLFPQTFVQIMQGFHILVNVMKTVSGPGIFTLEHSNRTM